MSTIHDGLIFRAFLRRVRSTHSLKGATPEHPRRFHVTGWAGRTALALAPPTAGFLLGGDRNLPYAEKVHLAGDAVHCSTVSSDRSIEGDAYGMDARGARR